MCACVCACVCARLCARVYVCVLCCCVCVCMHMSAQLLVDVCFFCACAAGFFLPLSGGVDSASVACVVANMCHILHEGISANTAASLENVSPVLLAM